MSEHLTSELSRDLSLKLAKKCEKQSTPQPKAAARNTWAGGFTPGEWEIK